MRRYYPSKIPVISPTTLEAEKSKLGWRPIMPEMTKTRPNLYYLKPHSFWITNNLSNVKLGWNMSLYNPPRVIQGRLVNYMGQPGVIFVSPTTGRVFNLPMLGAG